MLIVIHHFLSFQEKLLEAQNKRRNLSRELVEVRKKSNDLHEQIHKVKRQDDLQRFLDLMKEETDVLKQEQHISKLFADCDREEREIFTAFSNAIRDSHEKQRAQMEYTKYIGLVLSIAGSFLAFTYSTLRKEDLKRFVKESMVTSGVTTASLLDKLDRDHEKLGDVVNRMYESNVRLMALIENKERSVWDKKLDKQHLSDSNLNDSHLKNSHLNDKQLNDTNSKQSLINKPTNDQPLKDKLDQRLSTSKDSAAISTSNHFQEYLTPSAKQHTITEQIRDKPKEIYNYLMGSNEDTTSPRSGNYEGHYSTTTIVKYCALSALIGMVLLRFVS